MPFEESIFEDQLKDILGDVIRSTWSYTELYYKGQRIIIPKPKVDEPDNLLRLTCRPNNLLNLVGVWYRSLKAEDRAELCGQLAKIVIPHLNRKHRFHKIHAEENCIIVEDTIRLHGSSIVDRHELTERLDHLVEVAEDIEKMKT